MKTKKVLTLLLTGFCGLGAIMGLTSCKKDKTKEPENPTPQQPADNDDEEKVDNALSTLSVDAKQNSNFTLTTSAVGGVTISWASSNPDVISISGGSATVTRPAFTGADATVTLTATAVSGSVSKTKTFTVTVEKLVDESKTVAAIKALDVNSPVYARGVVTGFLYGNSQGSQPETKQGFYITDATGTIYVFGSQTAAQVEVGNEVYFSGTRAEYNSAAQISNPSNLSILNANATADWTTVVKDKTVSEVIALGSASVGNVYEFVTTIGMDGYNNYKIQDPTNASNYMNLYFSGSITAENVKTYHYNDVIEDYVNQTVKVRFVVNSVSKKPRGHVLSIVPFTKEEQLEYIEDVVKNCLDLNTMITETKEVELPTSFDSFPDTTISWALGAGSAGAVINGETGVLTVTPTDAIQTFTLVATVTVEGENPIEITLDEYQVCTTFDAVTHAEWLAASKGAKLFVEGTITYVYNTKYANMFIQDDEGYGYCIYGLPSGTFTAADFNEGGKFAVGTKIKIYGELDIYKGLYELKNTEKVEIIPGGTPIAARDIADVVNSAEPNYEDLVSVFVKLNGVYFDGINFVTSDNKTIKYDDYNLKVTVDSTGIYDVEGIIGIDNGTYTFQPTKVTESTQNVAKNLVEKVIKSLFSDTYFGGETVVLPETLYGHTITYSIQSGDSTYDEATHTLTVASVSGTSELQYTIGTDEPLTGTITITVDADAAVLTISDFLEDPDKVAKGDATKTGNHNFDDGELDKKYFGVDSSAPFTFTFQQKDSSTKCAINYKTDGYIGLYKRKPAALNGNPSRLIIEGTGITITEIKITYGKNKSCATIVAGDDPTVNPDDGTVTNAVTEDTSTTSETAVGLYKINGSKVTICNTGTDSIFINKIEITYTKAN